MRPVLFSLFGFVMVNLADCSSNSVCHSSKAELILDQSAGVTITALLDLTKGAGCNQTNAEASHTLHGVQQAVRVLNQAGYLNSSKLGLRVYDTCGQDNRAVNSILATALDFNLITDGSCKNKTHLGFVTNKKLPVSLNQLLPDLKLPVLDVTTQQESDVPLNSINELLLKLNWTSLGLLSQSKQVMMDFSRKAREKNICVLAQGVVSVEPYRFKENIQRTLRRIVKSEAKAILVFGAPKVITEVAIFFEYHELSARLLLVYDVPSPMTLPEGMFNSTNNTVITVQPVDSLSDQFRGARAVLLMAKQFRKACVNNSVSCRNFESVKLSAEERELLKRTTDNSNGHVHGGFAVSAWLPGSVYSVATFTSNDQIVGENQSVIDLFRCNDCQCKNEENQTIWKLKSDWFSLILTGINGLGMVIVVSSTIVLRRSFTRKCKNTFLGFVIVLIMLLYFSSLLFLVKANQLGCDFRFLLLSASCSLLVCFLFSRTVAKFVQPDPANNISCQLILFLFSLAIQCVILTYELQASSFNFVQKVVTDFGAKFECWFPSTLLFKLFVYPGVLQLFLFLISCLEIRHYGDLNRHQVCLYSTALLTTPALVACVLSYTLLAAQWHDLSLVITVNVINLILYMFFIFFPAVEELGKLSGKRGNESLNFDSVASATEDNNRQPIYATPSHEYDSCPPQMTISTHL